jgi:hypothetical protein
MNAAIVSRTLSLIPERVLRAQSGSLFDPQAPGACPHPERITHLAQFLDWLGPLKEVTKDDLRVFGLLTAYGKPAAESLVDEDADTDADVELNAELEPVAAAPLAIEATLPPVPALT